MFSSLRASLTQHRTIALGGALGAAGLASIWLVSDAPGTHVLCLRVLLILFSNGGACISRCLSPVDGET